jgi:hypothetical protein
MNRFPHRFRDFSNKSWFYNASLPTVVSVTEAILRM